MKTIKICLLGIWQDHRNYLAVATLAATGCEITFTLHGSNCKKSPENSCTLLSILIKNQHLFPLFLFSWKLRWQGPRQQLPLLMWWATSRRWKQIFSPAPHPAVPLPSHPQFKVAGGLGSYHEMFCQIKCKQMTCTVDMATKQPCTQRGSI